MVFFSGDRQQMGGCGKYITSKNDGKCYKLNGLHFTLLIYLLFVGISFIIACIMKIMKQCKSDLVTVNMCGQVYKGKRAGDLFISLSAVILSVWFLQNKKMKIEIEVETKFVEITKITIKN